MFGIPSTPSLGMLSVAGMEPNARNNDQEQMDALQKLYATTQEVNRTPNGRVERGFIPFGPQASQASGPDVIQKLMNYFHKKDHPN